MMALSKLKAQLLFSLLFLIFCLDFYSVQFFQLPYGVHEWSNGERLSLAFGYYDNGMIFFKPTTFNQESIDGVVGHEFPIQSYVAALIGQAFGRESIVMNFRAINIFIFFVGLSSLFAIVFGKTKSFLFALIPPVFFISSPMFVDYSGGFLPDPASASIVFVSFFHLVSFIDTEKRRNLVFAILLLTLATLMKTSSIIYLAGVLLFFLINHTKKSKTRKDWIIFLSSSVLSCACILGYYLYNGYLNTHYHATLFPTKPMPFKDKEDISYYFSISFKHNWMDQYFIVPAYVLFVSIISACLPVFRKETKYKPYVFLSVFFFLFLIPVFIIMGNQLHVHDYYIICMFFPLLAWLIAISAIVLFNKTILSENRSMIRSSLIGTLLILYCLTNFSTYQRLDINNPRTGQWSRVEWMKNGAQILKRLKIPNSERILVLNEMPPNQGLLYFDRKGYVFYSDRWSDNNSDKIIEFMNERKLKIAVCDSKRVANTENVNPSFYKDFIKLYSDDKATVFKRN